VGEVLSRDALLGRIRRDRCDGRSIALANGCFDLLHVGHVRYLAAAAEQADKLIVAVNDDPAVAALKGAGRPILRARDRAELVAALRAVDYVVIFSEPTAARLLETLRPDVHCKGTDYTVDTVPERDQARALGVRSAIVGDPKEHSTRDLLRRVAERRPTARGAISTAAERDREGRGSTTTDT
jgi:rfaE bifunctional protein nucleotidyltransferase chain/domain